MHEHRSIRCSCRLKKKRGKFPLFVVHSVCVGHALSPMVSRSIVVFAPAGTPSAVISRLNAEIVKTLKSREVQDFMAREGAEPVGSSPQELGAHFRGEVERYAEVIRIGRIQLE